MRIAVAIVIVLGFLSISPAAARATLMFEPAAGYEASVVWSGADAAHFAADGGAYYILGAQQVEPGSFQTVVRLYDGASTTEIARTSMYAAAEYSPDAITAVGGEVYWAQVRGFSAASVLRTSFNGDAWTTSTVLDESAGINVYSLSTDGANVFGVGLDGGGNNVAFYFDDQDQYNVLAEIPGFSGGSGFDPSGNFFAGASDGSFVPHMYQFSAGQVSDRLDGTQVTPYSDADAVADLLVPGNSSAVMESDGDRLFGSAFKPSFTGSDPFSLDLSTGESSLLGTLSGAEFSVTTDLYHRDGRVLFMGKDSFSSGSEAAIYEVVPEPATTGLLAAVASAICIRSRRRDLTGACGFRAAVAAVRLVEGIEECKR